MWYKKLIQNDNLNIFLCTRGGMHNILTKKKRNTTPHYTINDEELQHLLKSHKFPQRNLQLAEFKDELWGILNNIKFYKLSPTKKPKLKETVHTSKGTQEENWHSCSHEWSQYFIPLRP